MIIIPDFTHFRNGELIKFGDLSITILYNYTFEETKLVEQREALKTTHESVKTLYKLDRRSRLTAEVGNEDQLRDNMSSAIRLILQAHVNYHPDEDMKKKAKELVTIFDKHGTDLNRHSYHLQTANLDDIFSDIDKRNLQGNITELGCGLYYSTLLQSNKRFDTLYLERNKEYAQAPKEKMADLRITLEESFKKMFSMINAALIFGEPTVYQPLVDELNSLVGSYITLVNKRLATRKDDTDKNLNQDFDEIQE